MIGEQLVMVALDVELGPAGLFHAVDQGLDRFFIEFGIDQSALAGENYVGRAPVASVFGPPIDSMLLMGLTPPPFRSTASATTKKTAPFS